MNDELGYISSADFAIEDAADGVKHEDELNLSTLQEVLLIIDEEIRSYLTVDRIDYRDATFSAEAQVKMNKDMVSRLRVLKKMLEDSINGVKEKHSGR